MRKYFLIIISIVIFSLQSLSQSSPAQKIDSLNLESLKKRLPAVKGEDRVDLLNEIAARTNFVVAKSKRKDSIFFYAQKSYDEANKIEYKVGIAMALFNLSYETVQNVSDSVKSSKEEYIRKGMQLGKETGNNEVLGTGYYLLSGIPSFAKDFEKQSDCYRRSAEYFLKAGDTLHAAEVTNWLFDLYFDRGKFEDAFDIGKKAVFLSQKTSDRDISRSWQQFLVQYSLSNMSGLYSAAGDYETAMNYLIRNNQYAMEKQTGWIMNGDIALLFCDMGKYDSALVYWNRWRYSPYWDSYGDGHKAWGYRIRGSIHLGQKEYDAAIDTFKISLAQMKKQFGFTPPDGTTPFAEAYYGKKEYNTALQYARQGLPRQKELEVRPQLLKTYQLLSDIFHQIGNNDSAYYYLIKYNTLKDSIQNRQFLLRIYNSKREVEDERKTSQINLLNKDNQLKKQKLKQEATVKKSLIAVLILIVLLAAIIFRTLILKRKSELQKQKLENEKKQAELQQRATELEMEALRAQMNPHFIFNCLSSINKFILTNDTDGASDYLTRFSRLIRQVLTNSQLSTIPLSDEVEMLRLYLDMERLRFSESFDYNIIYENTIEPETIYIPPMLLQPFCENAIWHGLMHKEGQGKLEVMLSLQNGQLQCTIADNGVGREKAAEIKNRSNGKQKSFGLKITTDRLALFNNEKLVNSFYKTEDVLDPNGKIAGTKVVLNVKYKNSVQQPVNKTV